MHVGWVACFSAPEDGADLPSFAELRAHVAGRLHRAPRYLQRVEPVPLGVHQPAWVDAEDFDLDEHLRHAIGPDLDAIADAVFSTPLPRDRPLWQLWVADRLEDGSLGLIGKVHHCMVDGLAAVELGAALLDVEPDRGPLGPGRRFARLGGNGSAPEPADLFAVSLLDRMEEQARAAQAALATFARPLALPRAGARMARALMRAALPPAPGTTLNGAQSPRRHLARTERPLEDLKRVRARFGVTVNDVLLAAVAGGLRTFMRERGDACGPMKAMVPVSVREEGERLGNRISFMFVELPCQEADPLVRLMRVNRETAVRKREGDPEEADAALGALEYAPRLVQKAITGMVASRRMFNLVVSNIPGPPVPMYLRGCPLEAAWPVVPLADGHALSVGMTTVNRRACLGLYADSGQLPDSDRLAGHVGAAVDELVGLIADVPEPVLA